MPTALGVPQSIASAFVNQTQQESSVTWDIFDIEEMEFVYKWLTRLALTLSEPQKILGVKCSSISFEGLQASSSLLLLYVSSYASITKELSYLGLMVLKT